MYLIGPYMCEQADIAQLEMCCTISKDIALLCPLLRLYLAVSSQGIQELIWQCRHGYIQVAMTIMADGLAVGYS